MNVMNIYIKYATLQPECIINEWKAKVDWSSKKRCCHEIQDELISFMKE